jgi:hypothetical protein
MLDSVATPALQQLSEECSSLIAKLAVAQATLRAMVDVYQYLDVEQWSMGMMPADEDGKQDSLPRLMIPDDQVPALNALLELVREVR